MSLCRPLAVIYLSRPDKARQNATLQTRFTGPAPQMPRNWPKFMYEINFKLFKFQLIGVNFFLILHPIDQ